MEPEYAGGSTTSPDAEMTEHKPSREMLELAAKAAGYEVLANKQAQRDEIGSGGVGLWIKGISTCWNPRDDDGDALRLLAAMPSLWSLSLKFGAPSVEMDVAWGYGPGIVCNEFAGEGVDRAAAIRLAITRAAAEVGKAMP